MMTNLYGLTRAELGATLARAGFADVHAGGLWGRLYRGFERDFGAMRELPPRLIDWLRENATLCELGVARETAADDGLTTKSLLALSDGREIETVRMQIGERTTACLSSQVGCALGCVFCATGQMGFERNLTAGEIVAQALHVARAARANGSRLRNVVVMGMGEPLLNYDAVMTALDVLRDPAGSAIGFKQITVSTVGVAPGIVRMADEGRPYSLAVSLHAANQTERAALLPAARTWPLDVLLDACRYYAAKTGRRIFFEWTVIAGRNDALEQAAGLATLLAGLPAHVNLIPLNATTGFDGAAGEAAALDALQARLRAHGLPATVRRTRGEQIAAACGQLAV